MNTSKITLTVDDREPESVFRRLEDRGFNVIKERLNVGDIVVRTPNSDRLLGIERKTWGDLLASVRRNQKGQNPRVSHLHYQVREMLKAFDISILLLDGGFRPTPDGGIQLPDGREVAAGAFYQADNALLSIQQRGVVIAHCLDREALGERVLKLITWADKGSHTFGNGRKA